MPLPNGGLLAVHCDELSGEAPPKAEPLKKRDLAFVELTATTLPSNIDAYIEDPPALGDCAPDESLVEGPDLFEVETFRQVSERVCLPYKSPGLINAKLSLSK